jgi:hypothetical protein
MERKFQFVGILCPIFNVDEIKCIIARGTGVNIFAIGFL